MKDEELKGEQQQKKKEKKPQKKNKKAVGVFAKKYKLEKAEKKLFSRIYVDADREYARSLFVEQEDKKGRKYLAIPKDMRFTKKEVSRLKLISADVKSQKGRVKIVALLITAALIAGVIIFLSLFKNVLVKKAIKAGGEAAFGAACDVGSVSFKPLAGYLSIQNLEIADKSSPWKNVVQIDRITSDFDLTLLLQGKFIVEEMSVTGIQTGTDRSYDGTLAPKEKKQKEKKPKKEKEPKEENKEPSKLALKVAEISDEMYGRFTSALSDLFDQYDPEKILAGLYSQLSVPDVVNTAMDFGADLTESLQQKASGLEHTVSDIKNSIDTVTALDFQAALTNPLLIKDYYAVVMDAVDTAVDAYDAATDTVDYIKDVADDVKDQYDILTTAAGKDTDFLKGQVDVIKGISAGDAFDFLEDTGADLVKTVLGEAYGYIETGLTYIKSLKKDDKPKKEKLAPAERLPGRTVTYRNHNEPKVWIKYLEGSGPKLQFTAKNISSDEKAAGGPAVLDFNGHDLAFSLGSDSASQPGLASAALFDLNTTIHDTGDFVVEGNLALAPFVLRAGTFNPEMAAEIVNSVFARFDSVTAGFTAASDTDGMKFTFDTDIGTKLLDAVKDEWDVQLERIKEMIMAELKARIEGYVNNAIQSLTGYTDLESAISGYTAQIEGYKQQLEDKKKEVTDLVDSTMDAIMDEVERLKAEADRMLKEAEGLAQEKAEELKKQAEEALAEAERLKNEAEQAVEQVQQMKDDAVDAVQNAVQNAKEEAEAAAKAELERRQKEIEDAAKAKAEAAKKAAEEEAERLKKEAEAAAQAETERLKKEAEEAAKKAAEEAAKKAADGAMKALKGFF